MKIIYINFPSILDDNEMLYYDNLGAYIESIDQTATIRVTKKLQGINVRISPSHPRYLPKLIQDMKRFHTLFGLILEFSKSMKKTCTISYDISI